MKRSQIALAAVVIVGSGLALVPVTTGSAAPVRPWMNTALPPDQRAKLLVQAMMLDEKVLQIHMMDVPSHPREVQAIPRLGLPAFKITNGPLGAGPGDSTSPQPATALPSAVALSAAWDTSLATSFGTIAGQEVGDRAEHLLEAPGVNIARVPRNGRNFEYFGEDPYLSGQMSVFEVKAVQAQGVLAEVKHYAANNQENQRKTINVAVDERTLREIYLPAFEATVKQGDVAAVMCAYPKVNGQFGCENTHLLKDILRGDWGFQGFVQSDYTATHSTVAAAKAGLDLSMKHDFYGAATKTAVQNGSLKVSVVDGLLIHRFTQMFKWGWFDNPPKKKPIPAKADGAVARAADVAIVMVGNRDHEGGDRSSLGLGGNQDALIAAVVAANPHTVVVLKTGGPVLMPWLSRVPAVLEAWYPGEEDGNVVANLLFGKVNPSSKLTMSFHRNEKDTPANTSAQYPGVNGTVHYTEALQVGYRWYDAHNDTPLFPFGFGLSYTSFSFANLSVPSAPKPDGTITVSVDVTNTGSRTGAEVVQVYVSAPASAGEPPKQLKGFAKVSLAAGQTRRVTVTLQDRAFAVWSTSARKWTAVPGVHTVLVGDSSRNLPLKDTVTVS